MRGGCEGERVVFVYTQERVLATRSLIDRRLKQLVPIREGPHSLIFRAALYSLLLPGKRLRPFLTLSVLEEYEIPVYRGVDPSCALEMVHTYSLIHDDLPCMDNDDIRRGKPSLHKAFGEGTALLAGNFLLTRAFEIVADHPRLLTILTSRCGADGLIGGQLVDLLYEGRKVDWGTLQFIYLNKTAALFSTALEFGGVIAEVSEGDRIALKMAGQYFGVAFQLRDDLSDSISEGSGKCSDLINKKATCLSLFSRERAEELITFFLGRALSSLPRKMSSLRELFFHHLKAD